MYHLTTSLLEVDGIGEKIFAKLQAKNITRVKDLLLNLPLHYVDRSNLVTIDQLVVGELVTFSGQVTSLSNFYRPGRSIQSATVKDVTGRVKLMWFNNKYILNRLQKGETYLFSGQLGAKGAIVHPVVEGVGGESIHTGRIVPVYTSTLGLQVGRLRRILKHILDNLSITAQEDIATFLPKSLTKSADLIESDNIWQHNLQFCLTQLHFPDQEKQVALARQRLALEELLVLIQHSHLIKAQWRELAGQRVPRLTKTWRSFAQAVPKFIPYTLTNAQLRSLGEILVDLGKKMPMNRLLIGDVGSGKTVVAGIAAYHFYQQGHSSALVAPTKILAQQHAQTLRETFPDLKIILIETGWKANYQQPALYVGTHGVINRLAKIKPALVIYDEQHRFGVAHRSRSGLGLIPPHVLTMTATPIPRSLMLTIFAHLELSLIDEMPVGRQPTETWLVGEVKRHNSYDWMINQPGQVIVVCPFIAQSAHEALSKVANVKDKYQELKQYFAQHQAQHQQSPSPPRLAYLHSQMTKRDQTQVTQQLFAGQVDILVTTPIVEVGLDLPGATTIVIENAERFGLASLHQLRGRVGRRGQQGYCLLFSQSSQAHDRLKFFSQQKNGLKLAEYDLQNRGAGNIFGFDQTGFDNLRFANWADTQLISQARQIYNQLMDNQDSVTWLPLVELSLAESDLPLAN